MSSILEQAIRHREKVHADQQAKEQHERDVAAAYEELRERTFRVSMPDYGGADSHLQIKQDRDALEAYIEHLDPGEGAHLPAREDRQKGTDELLTEIRDSLDGSKS